MYKKMNHHGSLPYDRTTEMIIDLTTTTTTTTTANESLDANNNCNDSSKCSPMSDSELKSILTTDATSPIQRTDQSGVSTRLTFGVDSILNDHSKRTTTVSSDETTQLMYPKSSFLKSLYGRSSRLESNSSSTTTGTMSPAQTMLSSSSSYTSSSELDVLSGKHSTVGDHNEASPSPGRSASPIVVSDSNHVLPSTSDRHPVAFHGHPTVVNAASMQIAPQMSMFNHYYSTLNSLGTDRPSASAGFINGNPWLPAYENGVRQHHSHPQFSGSFANMAPNSMVNMPAPVNMFTPIDGPYASSPSVPTQSSLDIPYNKDFYSSDQGNPYFNLMTYFNAVQKIKPNGRVVTSGSNTGVTASHKSKPTKSTTPNHGNDEKKKRTWSRAVFTNFQRQALERQFKSQMYINKPQRRELATILGLSDAQVKVWFQNRRMKWRHSLPYQKSLLYIQQYMTQAHMLVSKGKKAKPKQMANSDKTKSNGVNGDDHHGNDDDGNQQCSSSADLVPV